MRKNKSIISINCTTIFLVFLILKLTHVVEWSWWWIFSPYLIPIGIFLIIIILSLISKIK